MLLGFGALVGAMAVAVIDESVDPVGLPPREEPSPSILNRLVLPHYVIRINLSNATWEFGSPTLGDGELLILLFQLMRGPCLYGFGDGGSETELAPVAFRALEHGDSTTITFHPRAEDAPDQAACSGQIALHPSRQQLVVRLGDADFVPRAQQPA